MEKMTVRLDTIDKVKNFSEIIARYNDEADLISGRYRVDAKSVMGIFSLDLEKDIELVLNGNNNDKIMQELSPFRV